MRYNKWKFLFEEKTNFLLNKDNHLYIFVLKIFKFLFLMNLKHCMKKAIFGVFSVRIQSECGKTRTRKTPNTDTFFYDVIIVITSHFRILGSIQMKLVQILMQLIATIFICFLKLNQQLTSRDYVLVWGWHIYVKKTFKDHCFNVLQPTLIW